MTTYSLLSKSGLLIILFLAVSCQEKIEQSDDNLVRDFFFGHEGEVSLTNPTYIASDKKDHIFISDPFLSRIFHYDLDGKQQNLIGNRGSGPGEFIHQSAIHFNSNRLFVEDQGNKRVAVLEPDGNELTLFSNNQSFIEFSVHQDKIYAFAPESFLKSNNGTDSLITVLDGEGNFIDSFGTFIRDSEGLPSGISWPYLEIENDQLHVLFNYFPVYRAYELNGNLLQEFDLSLISDILPEEGNQKGASHKYVTSPNVQSVYKDLDVHENDLYALRLEMNRLIIDHFWLGDENPAYMGKYEFSDVSEGYYAIKFFYASETESFYVLEKNEIPMVTKYRIKQ